MFSDLEEGKELEIDKIMEINMLNEFHKKRERKEWLPLHMQAIFALIVAKCTAWTPFMAGRKKKQHWNNYPMPGIGKYLREEALA